ncbi:MAG: hypothetical protein SV765_12075 [Pseudomonadota bacterium]|nr:hypothetical protein [Pseudomonadota bacterium]
MQKPEHLKIKGIEASWGDLSRWLIKGGAATDSRWFYRDATAKTWQGAIKDRLHFVEAIRNLFNQELARGAAGSTVSTYINHINVFMKWVDENNIKCIFRRT